MVDGPPALEPLAIEEEPLWTSEVAGPFRFFGSAAFHGDSLVLQGGERRGSTENLGVLDAATGAVRWSVGGSSDPDGELPGGDGAYLGPSAGGGGIVDHASGWVVLVDYDSRGVDLDARDYGIAALSGADGHVLWQTPIEVGPRDDELERRPRVTYGADGVAVVVLAGPDPEPAGSSHQTDNPRLVAVDTSDGTILWEREGLGAAAVAAGTVFAYAPNETQGPIDQLTSDSVVALDAATGAVRWSLSDRYRQSTFVLAAGDLAAILVPSSEEGSDLSTAEALEVRVVEAVTGREVTSFGATASGCAADDELIACRVGVVGPGPRPAGDDMRLATLQVDDREASVSEATLPDGVTNVLFPDMAVVDDRIVIEQGMDQGVDLPALSFDRFANVIDAELPGRYAAMSDRYAIFEPERGRRDAPEVGYTVHRIAD